jgi:N-acetyl-gamma-glutamyl-phosphate reductase
MGNETKNKQDMTSGARERMASPFGGSRKGAVGIIGGAGYTGGELIRLLINHPDVAIEFIHSRSNADKLVSTVHQDLIGETDLVFTANSTPLGDGGIDVLFLCLGHGESKNFFQKIKYLIR